MNRAGEMRVCFSLLLMAAGGCGSDGVSQSIDDRGSCVPDGAGLLELAGEGAASAQGEPGRSVEPSTAAAGPVAAEVPDLGASPVVGESPMEPTAEALPDAGVGASPVDSALASGEEVANAPAAESGDASESLRVMSFNILFNNLLPWERREPVIMDMLRAHDPDVIGLQENDRDGWPKDQVLGFFPSDRITAHLTHYVESSRPDARMNAILYKRDRFEELDSGWVELDPAVFYRHCYWVLLRDRRGRHFYLFNTHWHHVDPGDAWMNHGTTLIALMRDRAHPEYPALATGDFNTTEGVPGQAYLRGRWAPLANGYPLRDTWQDLHGPGYGGQGSYNGLGGPRLDYVFAPLGEWTTLAAEVIDFNAGGVYPSDHLPVMSVLALAGAGGG